MTAAPRPRHFGDPAAEYRAAQEGVAVMDRSDRARWLVVGRSPVQMVNGLSTNRVPDAPAPVGEGIHRGRSLHAIFLTPKGKMLTDLRTVRLGVDEREDLLLDLPAAGASNAREHLRRFLPPRFARVVEVSDGTGHLTLVGPGAAACLAETLEFGGGEDEWSGLEPGHFLVNGELDVEEGVWPAERILVVRPELESGIDGFDVVGASETLAALIERWTDAGVTRIGQGVWETLRVEAGRPSYGVDLDDRTIPLEADLGSIAIDRTKGCYTGQEVIIRILDRGHVNRHLRGLRFQQGSTPPAGTELHSVELGKVVGTVTSAVESPRAGGPVGLGFVRREVELPGTVRIGAPDGPEVEVVERDRILTDGGPV